MLTAAAAGVVAAANASDLTLAISPYRRLALSLCRHVRVRGVRGQEPGCAHRLILSAYVWAAVAAALLGIIGYFDLLADARGS